MSRKLQIAMWIAVLVVGENGCLWLIWFGAAHFTFMGLAAVMNGLFAAILLPAFCLFKINHSGRQALGGGEP